MSQKIIVCWCPLSWKSTFSNKISQELNLSHIPTDGFVTAFEDTFPNLGIGHQNVVSLDTRKDVSEKFYPFLKSFIEELDEESTYWGYIVEWFHIDIENVARDFWNTHKILVFGYPNISEEKKLQIIRKHDTNNWTNEIGDIELQKEITLFLELSTYYENICKENAIEFIDTSFDRDNKIEKTISEII